MSTLYKSDIKLIHRLSIKKNRYQDRLFVAEGVKIVKDLLDSGLKLYKIFATNEKWSNYDSFTQVTDSELKKISNLKSPNEVVAIFHFAEDKKEESSWCLVYEELNDPGNLGTIMRTADWYGISTIYLSYNSVDVYNAKTIQAAKGSTGRVQVVYVDLEHWLQEQTKPIYGTFMEGKDINSLDKKEEGIIVFGNEANGISKPIEKCIHEKWTIAKIGTGESLNVAIASSIIMHQALK